MRGAAARTRLVLLAVALLTLQLFALTGTFASAHTPGEAKAKARPGIASSVQPADAGAATLREPCRSHEPARTPQTRDRRRGTVCAGAPQHPPISRQAAAPPAAAAPGAAHRHLTRSSRAHSPAALQVFRC
ncbi:hypothetical protein ACWDFL_04275 [Streptomyces bungoensis]